MAEIAQDNTPQVEAQQTRILGDWTPIDTGDGRQPYSPSVPTVPETGQETPTVPQPQADLVPNTTEAVAAATTAPPASAAQPQAQEPVAQPAGDAEPIVDYSKLGLDADYVNAYKDDSFKEFFNAYKEGKLQEYLADRTTDYNKVSDEALVKMQLARKYENIDDAELRQKAIDRAFAKNYPLTGDSDEDADVLESMKIDAAIERSQRIKEQAQRKEIPTYDQSKAQEEQRIAAEAELNKQIESYLSQPSVKQFETSRTAMIGEGEEAFKLEVPQNVDLRNVLSRPDKNFFPLFVKENGTWDDDKWHTVVAIAANFDNFRKTVAEHYKAIGEKSEFLKSRNIPSVPENSAPPQQTRERMLGDFTPFN